MSKFNVKDNIESVVMLSISEISDFPSHPYKIEKKWRNEVNNREH